MGEEDKSVSVIITALLNAMSSMGLVSKGGHNDYSHYDYATEANILEEARPALIKEGLILLPVHTSEPRIDEYGNTIIRVDYRLAHTSGAVWPDIISFWGVGNDRQSSSEGKLKVGDKGIYKAYTGATKYAYAKILSIITGDDPEKPSTTEKRGNAKGKTQVKTKGGTQGFKDAAKKAKGTRTKAGKLGAKKDEKKDIGDITVADVVGKLQKKFKKEEHQVSFARSILQRVGVAAEKTTNLTGLDEVKQIVGSLTVEDLAKLAVLL